MTYEEYRTFQFFAMHAKDLASDLSSVATFVWKDPKKLILARVHVGRMMDKGLVNRVDRGDRTLFIATKKCSEVFLSTPKVLKPFKKYGKRIHT